MQYRPLGGSGIKASVVGMGTWAIGGWMWGGTDEGAAVKGIHAACDAGINLIDTAPVYGFGVSEQIVGKAIADRRDKVVLATKCGLVWDSEAGTFHFSADEKGLFRDGKGGDIRVHKYLNPDSIRREVEQSLTRLHTDYIDLYQTHWQDSATPIADTMSCLLKLKDEGKIRAIGCSNATAAQMTEYGAVGPLDTDQERYSMLDREIESDQLPFCREHNVAILAYSPLALGILTGKIGPEREFGEGDLRNDNPRFSADNREKIIRMLEEFKPVAEAHNITMAQLIIAWTINRPGVTHALCGARNPQQAIENAAAGDVILSDDDISKIDTAYEKYAEQIV